VLIIVIVKHCPLIIFWTTTSAACRPRPVIPKLRWQTFETAIIERYRRRESPVEGRGGTEALIEMAARIGGASLPLARTSCSARSRFGEVSSHRGGRLAARCVTPTSKRSYRTDRTPPTRKEKTVFEFGKWRWGPPIPKFAPGSTVGTR
jgi:hypothetical protein